MDDLAPKLAAKAANRQSAGEILASIRDGGTTAVAAVEAALSGIAGWSELNATAHLNADAALAAARRVDAGEITGPLAGLPIVVKDNIQVAGLPAAAGTPGLQDAIAGADAPVLAKLVEAGAIVVATANMHELAFGISGYNPTYRTGSEMGVRNPFDLTRFAAGSSSGTGALVGSGAVAAGLGTDTGGSVRLPAAINGISGLRPTLGRYPAEGLVPISRTRDTAGALAASVADIELIDRVITGAAEIQPAALKGLKLGLGAEFLAGLDEDVQAVWNGVIARLEAEGVEFVTLDVAEIFALNHAVSFPVCFGEAGDHLRDYLAAHVPGKTIEDVVAAMVSPDVRATYESFILPGMMPTPDGGLTETAPIYRHAIEVARPALIEAYRKLFAESGVAAVIFPTTPQVAAKQAPEASAPEVFGAYIRNADPSSNAGIPGLSVAAGLGPVTGLPVGIELDGPEGSDRDLLAIGMAIESLLGRTALPVSA
ncbi:amidase family protein [Paracoccus sp. MBLB3053]|uniref:Amidase family protein n=1 Tax=Paracoccus aurantius TaxID=3073814 RepID=A0ABU2HW38_9RHOB|nr:amidase family protein [Paracoccus sp. MBLB3053]MDS9469268.1 amidase family protein [Paracoccus sp. MBLB3053]